MIEQIIEAESIKTAIFFMKIGVGFLGIIASLAIYIWVSSQKRIDGLITSQEMFFETMSDFKKGLAVLTEIVQRHDKQIDNLQKK